MATLDEVVRQAAKTVRELEGMRAAPDYPPDTADVFPFAVVYPRQGVMEAGTVGTRRALHTVVVEVHVARKDLPRDIERVMPFMERVSDALLGDTTLAGKASTFARLRYEFGPLGWAGVQTIGFRFFIEEIKILA